MLNAEVNGVALDVVCDDIVDRAIDADVLLAGDVWYERAPAARFAPWLGTLVRSGVRVFTGDPSRHYVPPALGELARYDVTSPASALAARG